MSLFSVLILSLLLSCNGYSDTSTPVGQQPSIVYSPYSTSLSPFLIYNSAQGLESILCDDDTCNGQRRQMLKCNAKIYSSSLLAITKTQQPSSCNKYINDKLFKCYYYILIGYGSLTGSSNINTVSFITCYDDDCNIDNANEVIIDTSFNQNIYPFGYSTSLSSYLDISSSNRYPMFTYSKYDYNLNRYILNVIICTSFICDTWIGKEQSSFPNKPPYVILGHQSAAAYVSKGHSSIQEVIDQNQQHYVVVMYTKAINMTDIATNKTLNDQLALTVSSCSLSTTINPCSSSGSSVLNTTIIFNNTPIYSNSISMKYYSTPNIGPNYPYIITTYLLENQLQKNNNIQLWILYCFDIYCSNNNITTYYNYKLRESKYISYPQLIIDSYNRPSISFFENSSSLMFMSCENKINAPQWNCTNSSALHPVTSLYSNSEFVTVSMQISMIQNKQTTNSLILFSAVVSPGIYNGSTYINCFSASCGMRQTTLIDNSSNTDKFSTQFNVTVFVIISWIVSFLIIFGIFSLYKFISPTNFISSNIRNAFLTKVSLDSSRIRPLAYWMFFAQLICSAMCIVPWFAYFDYDYKLYSLMIVPPFIPVFITLLLLLILHICKLSQNLCKILIIISILYWLSTCGLSYSFSLVWELKSDNCQVSDLSGLKIVILVGHIVTISVVIYLLFWNIKCFQALKLASPEKLRNIQNNKINLLTGQNNNKIISNSRLLQALHDGKI